VKDAAYLLSSMAGRSDRDDRTWNIPLDPVPDFTTHCNITNLEGVRIGVPRNAFGNNVPAPILASFQSALDTLASARAEIVDNADFPAAEEF